MFGFGKFNSNIDASSINTKKLRRDMEDEAWGACIGGGIGLAGLDAMDIGKMDDDELIRTAEENGFNLKKYKK